MQKGQKDPTSVSPLTITTNSYEQPAIKATVQLILNSDAKAEGCGLTSIPPNEVIIDPNPDDYLIPPHLSSTAPDLVAEITWLLSELRDLNARYIGRNTNEVQSYMSLTGEHEELELLYYQWSKKYFPRRGSLDRLNPRMRNDPYELFLQNVKEFDGFLSRLIMLEGTINICVLGMCVEYINSEFANQVLKADVIKIQNYLPHRFSTNKNAQSAKAIIAKYYQGQQNFAEFLARIGSELPVEFTSTSDLTWDVTIRNKIKLLAEDLVYFRFVQCAINADLTTWHKLASDLWARFEWDVFQGGSVLAVMTSYDSAVISLDSTIHAISIRRDGLLCHRQFPWLNIDTNLESNETNVNRKKLVGINLFVLETLTKSLYDAWDKANVVQIVQQGSLPTSSEHEKAAALAAAMATGSEDFSELDDATSLFVFCKSELVVDKETDPEPKKPREVTRRRFGVLRLRKFASILTKHFDCEWSSGVGSEVKVRRHGSHYYSLKNHGSGETVPPNKVLECLNRLNIAIDEFNKVCH